MKELRFDHQVQDTYPQRPRNCLKRLESGRLFTLFQPHQCHPPDACCTCQRILGQPGRVAQPPDALAQRKPPPHRDGLDSRTIGCVTPIVTGEVPGYLDRVRALRRLQNHLVRVGQLQRGQSRTLSDLRKIGVGNEPLGSVGETQFDAIFQ